MFKTKNVDLLDWMACKFPRTPGIYIIYCIVTGKVYIGQAGDLLDRVTTHASQIRRHKHPNKYINNSVKKYGADKFKIVVLEYITDASLLTVREQWWLDFYKQLLGKEDVFNFGDCVDCPWRGVKKRPEQSDHLCRNISMISPQGEVVTFKGIKRFCKEYDLPESSIASVFSGKMDHCRGWRADSGDNHYPFDFEYYKAHIGDKIAEDHQDSVQTHTRWMFLEFVSPDGKIYLTNQVNKFAKEQQLHRLPAGEMIKGESLTYQGWKLRKIHWKAEYSHFSPYPPESHWERDKTWKKLWIYNGDIKEEIENYSPFCEKYNLTISIISYLITHRHKSWLGWRLKQIEYKDGLIDVIKPNIPKTKSKWSKIVFVNGDIIKETDSIAQFADELNIKRDIVNNMVRQFTHKNRQREYEGWKIMSIELKPKKEITV